MSTEIQDQPSVSAETGAERASKGVGGVAAERGMPALRGGVQLKAPPGQAPAAGAFPDFIYNGGPVVSWPFVYTSFWGSQNSPFGSQWLSDPLRLERAGLLSQFHQELLQSNFMNVLSQYGVGAGSGSGCFIQTSFVSNVTTQLTDQEPNAASVITTIQSCIDAGVLPEPNANTTIVIYLDDNIDINDPTVGLVLCAPQGDTAFGYHNFFMTSRGNPCYYAIIPSLADTCLQESCPVDQFCSLHVAEPQFDRLTQVASHEFAEMTSDPQLNAWFSPTAGECGDICNGETDSIQAPNGDVWTVQPQYSKTDDQNTNGQVFCISQALSPIPRLSGPASSAGLLRRALGAADASRLLPLPSVRFDVEQCVVRTDQSDFDAYLSRLFYPIKHQHMFGDLAGWLRSAADMIEAREKNGALRSPAAGVSARRPRL